MESLYCTIFIVDVSQNPEEVDNVASRIVQLIEDHGGVIKDNNHWGKRRLAYPIRKRTSGYYVEIYFSANSRLNIPGNIEAEFRINDRVLRYLTYTVDKNEMIQRERNEARAKKAAPVTTDASTKNGRSDKARPAADAPAKAEAPVAETAPAAKKAPAEVEKAAKAEETAPAAKKAPAEVEKAAKAEETAPAAKKEAPAEVKKAAKAEETAPAEEAPAEVKAPAVETTETKEPKTE